MKNNATPVYYHRDTSCVSYSIVFLIVILTITSMYAGDPADPSPAEKTAFDNKLNRLRSNTTLHPHPVIDILSSLGGTLSKTVNCPEGSEISKVIINITTKQIKFDRGLVVDGIPVNVGENDIGWYQWYYPPPDFEDGMKIINACNYIMLDSATMVQQEEMLPYGPIADEGLLYHELLHGQLVIDSIMGSENFQSELCSCNFDVSAGDFTHDYIPAIEEAYLEALLRKLGEEDPKAHIISPPEKEADEDGKFEIEIADESVLADKENVSFEPYFPKGSNVDPASVDFVIKDSKIYITGMLIDKTKKGLVVVIIDPPGVFLFIGLEKAILIRPSPSVIPTIGHWAILIMMLFLAIIGVSVIKESYDGAERYYSR